MYSLWGFFVYTMHLFKWNIVDDDDDDDFVVENQVDK